MAKSLSARTHSMCSHEKTLTHAGTAGDPIKPFTASAGGRSSAHLRLRFVPPPDSVEAAVVQQLGEDKAGHVDGPARRRVVHRPQQRLVVQHRWSVFPAHPATCGAREPAASAVSRSVLLMMLAGYSKVNLSSQVGALMLWLQSTSAGPVMRLITLAGADSCT